MKISEGFKIYSSLIFLFRVITPFIKFRKKKIKFFNKWRHKANSEETTTKLVKLVKN